MSKVISLLALTASASAAAVKCRSSNVPTVYLPLNYYAGPDHKVSSNLEVSSTNTTIEVVVDQGSEDFWVFGPNSIMNYGNTSMGAQGRCNISVTPFYDYTASPSASAPSKFEVAYGYGTFTKIVQATIAVKDSFKFTSVAGLSSLAPAVPVAVADWMLYRLGSNPECPVIPFDKGILGIAPYTANKTRGPSFKQNLLESGDIKTPTMSLWFDETPESVNDTFTGGILFGGIETSKFSGPLVKVPVIKDPGTVGYYVPLPQISSNGKNATASPDWYTSCLVDSGTQVDELPISSENEPAFREVVGLTTDSIGRIAYPGKCNTIPRNLTIDLTWAGVTEGESVTIKVPVRNYARNDNGGDLCLLNLSTGGCMLSAPFASAAFFASDDENNEVAFAQGGISKKGDAVNSASVVGRIPSA